MKKLKLQILSDLHNEFYKGYPPEIEKTDADVIILAGDISTGTAGVSWAEEQAGKLLVPIIYVAGNHEYYGHEYYGLNKLMWDTALADSNTKFLHNEWVVIGGVRFIGSTLWTDFKAIGPQGAARNAAELYMNDYNRIRISDGKVPEYHSGLRALDTQRFNEDAVAFLADTLNTKHDGPTVVITHHGPSAKCHNYQEHGDADLISSAFWSKLERLIDPSKVTLWVYGHTHSNLRFEVNGVRVVCNQRGYQHDLCKGFDPRYTVEI